MMTVQELNHLAHEIAEKAARADVSTFSKPAGGNWREVVGNNQQLERAERYLTARGLLERKHDNWRLVRLLKRPRPWAPESAA
jgi:hypothetical protein